MVFCANAFEWHKSSVASQSEHFLERIRFPFFFSFFFFCCSFFILSRTTNQLSSHVELSLGGGWVDIYHVSEREIWIITRYVPFRWIILASILLLRLFFLGKFVFETKSSKLIYYDSDKQHYSIKWCYFLLAMFLS